MPKIILTGGGSGGSVSPLLAIWLEFRKSNKDFQFSWVGTRCGVEREMVSKFQIPFYAIHCAKLRRYFSLRNLIEFPLFFIGFFHSFFIIWKEKPSLVLSAGSFVSVPFVWAAWIMRVPIIIHQQDIRPGLANKLMAPLARLITVTFEKSLADYGAKARWIGNPMQDLESQDENTKKNNLESLGLEKKLPLVLIIGGGTGSRFINELVFSKIFKISKISEVVHITGDAKNNSEISCNNYHQYGFLDHDLILEIMRASSVVVSRCGLATLTELSYLACPTILIPMANTHQEDNAQIFVDQKSAIVLYQDELERDQDLLIEKIQEILNSPQLVSELGQNINKVMKRNASCEMRKIILDFNF